MPRPLCPERQRTPNEIASQIMMGNQQRQRPVLLAEGKSDVRIYCFITNHNCRLVYCQGKITVLSVMDLVRGKHKGVVAVVDADFDRVFNQTQESEDVITTDTHDVESLIIRQSAFKGLLLKYGLYRSDFMEFHTDRLQSMAELLRQNLLECGHILGCLRLISLRASLEFDFKALSHETIIRFVNDTLQVDFEALGCEVMGRCNTANKPVKWSVISRHINDECQREVDLWQVCTGHDLVNILVVYLRRKGISIDRGQLEKDLTLVFDPLEFLETHMYARLAEWQHRHPGYELLRPLPQQFRIASA